MEILLLLLLLAPLAGLFFGGDDEPDEDLGGSGSVSEWTDEDDELYLPEGNEYAVLLGGGNDDINGAEGSDILLGQAGDDSLAGGHSNDFLLGGDGNDKLYGNAGDDNLIGGAGNDLMQGGSGNDFFVTAGGADSVRGGDGDDFIDGRDTGGYFDLAPENLIYTAYTNSEGEEVMGLEDFLREEWIHGGFGQNITDDQTEEMVDELYSIGAALGDDLDGGNGNDTLLGDGGDTMNGGAGVDTFAIFGSSNGPVIIEDYDATTETIVIEVPDTVSGPLSFRDVGADVEVIWGTEVQALLAGVNEANLNMDLIEVRIFSPT